jgi:hypothetical protein
MYYIQDVCMTKTNTPQPERRPVSYCETFEMAEIRNNRKLNARIKRGIEDARKNRGRFIKINNG